MNGTSSPYSAATGLVCTVCGANYPLAVSLFGCSVCRSAQRPGALRVNYDYDVIETEQLSMGGGLWDYHQLLPLVREQAKVSLGERMTPLLRPMRLAESIKLPDILVKLETVNPTYSYKDRTNAISVSVARSFGYDKICCTSSGNHGVSLAAYAAAASMRCLVLLPPTAPEIVFNELAALGADAIIVDPSLGEGSVLLVLEELHTTHGWFISNRNAPLPDIRRFGNPFGLEGYKTIAYEIWQQLGGDLPEWCFVPVGGGDGFAGLWRGFQDLRHLGLATRLPRMVACQPEAGASLVAAVLGELEVVPLVATSPTIALSLVDERSSELSLHAIRNSGGTAVAVSDGELRQALDSLGRCGISLEPSSAAALAGLCKLSADGLVARSESSLILATGTSLRWPASFDRFMNHGRRVAAPNVSAIAEVIAI